MDNVDGILSYVVMGVLILLAGLLVWSLIKALVKTLAVVALVVIIWFAADEVFPEQTEVVRAQAVALASPIFGGVVSDLIESALPEGMQPTDAAQAHGSEQVPPTSDPSDEPLR